MFRGLDDNYSDDSDDSSACEDTAALKRKELTEKVVQLKEKLEKEEVDQNADLKERSSGPKIESERQKLKIENKPKDIPATVDELKSANQRLAFDQDLLRITLNKSIREGRVEEAEGLSDLIAAKELEFEVNKAAIAKDFLKRKQEQEEDKAKKRRKKLPWVFEPKKKWETKSNM